MKLHLMPSVASLFIWSFLLLIVLGPAVVFCVLVHLVSIVMLVGTVTITFPWVYNYKDEQQHCWAIHSHMHHNCICTHDHQFGFTKQHATDKCIYTVKSVIKYYTRQNSLVYTCFLDASKAFDRISQWTLFKKLIACNTPVLIVRMLMFWYERQFICVK